MAGKSLKNIRVDRQRFPRDDFLGQDSIIIGCIEVLIFETQGFWNFQKVSVNVEYQSKKFPTVNFHFFLTTELKFSINQFRNKKPNINIAIVQCFENKWETFLFQIDIG